MSPTILLSAAKLLVKNRKLQLALVGLQAAFIAYNMITDQKSKAKKTKKKKRMKRSVNAMKKAKIAEQTKLHSRAAPQGMSLESQMNR